MRDFSNIGVCCIIAHGTHLRGTIIFKLLCVIRRYAVVCDIVRPLCGVLRLNTAVVTVTDNLLSIRFV